MNKAKLYYQRYPHECSHRFLTHYGHFMRDNVLYIYYYLKKAKLLDQDYELYILQPKKKQMNVEFQNFFKKIFPSAYIMPTTENYYDSLEETKNKNLLQRYPFNLDGVRLMKYVPQIGKQRHLKRFKRKIDRAKKSTSYCESWCNYTKFNVDGFRDYCFKQYDFKPEVKKRILYVPRKDLRSEGATRARWISDQKLVSLLKNKAKEMQYEFLEWHNEDSIFEQIKMYSESEVIVGAQGSDFVNSFWTNENQLLLEIVPPLECPNCTKTYDCHSAEKTYYPFDMSSMFYNKETVRLSNETNLSAWWDLNPNQKRNWQFVLLKEHCKCPGDGNFFEIILSAEDRVKIINKIHNHICSLSKNSS